jgi:PAS domain S-box-containing protein
MTQQAETFARQIETVQHALRTLLQRAGGAEPQAVMAEAIEIISSNLEELNAVTENLRQAHDELELRVQERTAELSKANEALRYQANLLANVNDAIIATDEQDIITAWNRAAEEMYGWQAGEALGQPLKELIRQEFIDTNQAAVLNSLAQTGRWRGEIRQYRRDGTALVADVTTVALPDEAGRVVGYVSVNRDISERKQVEEMLRAGRERLQVLSQRLIEAQEAERRRVSRELHDEAGQSLTALKISLELMQADLLAESGKSPQSLQEAVTLANETMERIRLLAQGLRPPELDVVGLNPTLEDYCHDFAKHTRLSIDYAGTELPVLPDAVTICFYRVLQEALTNVAKHAHANQVWVALHCNADMLSLSVEDDGQGFDAQTAVSVSRQPQSIGLLGMRERLELLGGRLEIKSQPGQGTRLVAFCPWKDTV